MIQRLKECIDLSEDNQKVKKMFLLIAKLDEKKQEDALNLVLMLVDIKKGEVKK